MIRARICSGEGHLDLRLVGRGGSRILGHVAVDPSPLPPLLESGSDDPVVHQYRARAEAGDQLSGVELVEVVSGQLVEPLGPQIRLDRRVDLAPVLVLQSFWAAAHPLGVRRPFIEETPEGSLGSSVLTPLGGGHQSRQLLRRPRVPDPGHGDQPNTSW